MPPKKTVQRKKKESAPLPDEPHNAAWGFSEFVPLPADEFDVEPFETWDGFRDAEYEEIDQRDDEETSCFDSRSASVDVTEDESTPRPKRRPSSTRKSKSAFEPAKRPSDIFERFSTRESDDSGKKRKKTYSTTVKIDDYDSDS